MSLINQSLFAVKRQSNLENLLFFFFKITKSFFQSVTAVEISFDFFLLEHLMKQCVSRIATGKNLFNKQIASLKCSHFSSSH